MQFEQAAFPVNRFRRLRRSEALRDLVGENRLSSADFIWPLFIRDGQGIEEPIHSMPGVNRLSVDRLMFAAERAMLLGIRGYMFVSIYR